MNWQDRRNPRSGGAETHLHEIFGRLAGRGHDVSLLVSGWRGAPARETLDGMDVHRVGGRHSFFLEARRYYRNHLSDAGFDLLVEDLNKVPLFTPAWGGPPVVLLVHHLFGRTAFHEAAVPIAAATWLLEQPIPRAYRGVPVLAVSRSTAADLERRGFDPAVIEVVPNGVDLDFYDVDRAVARFPEPTLLYLGRLKRYKRVDLVLHAMKLLRGRGVEANLIVAGKGEMAPALERLARRLGLQERVRLPGFVSIEDKLDLFRRTWIHVLTSPKEGWGITNIEAAACGTPTVASDSPGLRDSVRHGETGLLVPHGDVSALADALERLLVDHDLRRRLGEQARSFAVHFDWDRSADRTEVHLLRASRISGAGRRLRP